MPEVAQKSQPLATRLREVLVRGLNEVGITAEIETEPIRGTRLCRALVISPQFEDMWLSERQAVVWDIIGRSFPVEDQIRISIVVTLTPEETGQDQGKEAVSE